MSHPPFLPFHIRPCFIQVSTHDTDINKLLFCWQDKRKPNYLVRSVIGKFLPGKIKQANRETSRSIIQYHIGKKEEGERMKLDVVVSEKLLSSIAAPPFHRQITSVHQSPQEKLAAIFELEIGFRFLKITAFVKRQYQSELSDRC